MADGKVGQTVLITGASGGIGYELVKIFARNRFNLVIVARSEKTLQEQATELTAKYGINVKVIAKDLVAETAAQEIFNEIEAAGLKIDILVNNAGFAGFGNFAETALEGELEMMKLNMITLTILTKLFLPGMVKNGAGKILNLASTASFQPGPLMAVYYATKAYVLSFSEALAEELEGTGVSITALCPGPTRTGFQARASMEKSKLVSGEIMDATTVAKAGFAGLMSNKRIVVPGVKNQIMAFSVRVTPRKMVTKLVKKMSEASH